MRQLGKALGILLKQIEHEAMLHDDVAAWGAPSECHDLVARGQERRHRDAMRHACHVAGVRNGRLLRRAMRRAMGNDAWVYRHYGVVPY